MSLSLTQAAPRHRHSHSHLSSSPHSLSSILTLHSHQPLLSRALSLSLSLTFCPSGSTHSQQWNFQPGPGFRIGTRVAVEANGSPVGWGTQSCNRKKQYSGREGRNQYPAREKRRNPTQTQQRVEAESTGLMMPKEPQVSGRIYPESLFPSQMVMGFFNSRCHSWRLAAPSAVSLCGVLGLTLLKKIFFLLQGCDSHGHKTSRFLAVLNSHYTLTCTAQQECCLMIPTTPDTSRK